ncbi:hypothetical protein [Roseovarius indicus]|uniref:hypothetical protein n=1 Tax=Roseovarius indicus TaxID=540747 RepID=UPI0032EE029E
MATYLILSAIRALLVTGFISYITSSILTDRARRLACAAIVALAFGALMDGITPDGWDYEYMFGHPFFFYLVANLPAVFAVLVTLLIWPQPATSEAAERP